MYSTNLNTFAKLQRVFHNFKKSILFKVFLEGSIWKGQFERGNYTFE